MIELPSVNHTSQELIIYKYWPWIDTKLYEHVGHSYGITLSKWGIYYHAGSSGQFSPSMRPHNPATGFRPPSATVVSAEPFLHATGTLWWLQKEMATYRHWSVSLRWDPDDVPHCRILSRQNWMAAYLGYTLWMKTLFRGWPVMVHDTHTRWRRLSCHRSIQPGTKPIWGGIMWLVLFVCRLFSD